MLPIKGFENYLITKDGLVVNKKTNRILKMSLQTTGYNQVCLSIKGVSKAFTVHRLVAENHIKNPNNYPCVNHINGIKTDNRVENLEWITYSDNHKHAFKLGLKKPPMYACKRVLNTEMKPSFLIVKAQYFAKFHLEFTSKTVKTCILFLFPATHTYFISNSK
jgi:hypothetical protein